MEMCPDIRVVPNYVERARWGQHRTRPNREGRPRVGWAGGVSHQGDLEIIADVVKATYKEIEWVFMGMCPDAMRPYVTFVPPVPLDQYPQKLVSLGLELGVAPLEIHPFNEAKSHLRILEYGILAIPIVCTDIFPYQGFPVKRVKNRFMDWRNAIMEAVADRDALQVAGEQLRALEDHLDVWESAWT
ncbi:glycosyltransferase family 4 protein [Acidithiobacillus ferrivorans]|nr:glycosyltransferase family 4 protein [Acidithiobacillus ferrivorans]